MPGLTGHALLERLRKIRPDVPAVLMSGYLETAPEEDCVFLPKPYDGEALERAVREAIARTKT
jgi:FixJ family two-component response regulator